ncbi:MAG: DegT/DnrJ/EryC1/StrS family aminotransferase [Bryobacteraceae bacterium]|jgi:dTDP-4-amino-4,6-dideoxygalactose transaminase
MSSDIAAFPSPRLRMVACRSGPYHEALAKYAGLCCSGRSALYHALASARLPRGATVWMPAFHCGVEVDAAVRAGFNVGFYRVAPDLSCDVEDLERRLRERHGSALVVHYYGFPQPSISSLAALCRGRGALLIEDCAHALFSQDQERQLGQYAPLAVFSLRKTLPLLEGGAYQWNDRAWMDTGAHGAFAGLARFSVDPYRLYAKCLARQIVGRKATDLYRMLRWGGLQDREEAPPPGQREEIYRSRMSALSRRLAAATAPDEVVERRRRNWVGLDARLNGVPGYQKVFNKLEKGVCPLFLPIWVSGRSMLMARLREQGIETFAFGTLAHPLLPQTRFPEAARLRESILCLPVHQQIRESDLDRMSAAVSGLLGRHSQGPLHACAVG